MSEYAYNVNIMYNFGFCDFNNREKNSAAMLISYFVDQRLSKLGGYGFCYSQYGVGSPWPSSDRGSISGPIAITDSNTSYAVVRMRWLSSYY